MTIHGKNTGVVIGPYDVTRYCNEVSSDMSVEVADASCFDEPEGAKVYVAGLTDATFGWGGRQQGTPDGVREAMGDVANLEMSAPFLVGIARGFHAGRIAVMGNVLTSSINLSAPVTDVVSVSGDLQSDGPVENGLLLTKKDAYTATTQGSTIDQVTGGASARIQYHVVQNSRNGDVTVTVQDSGDGSTWVDYDTFVVAGGSTDALSRVVADAVGRYVRVIVNLAGSSGEATIRVAIAKRSA